MKTRKVDGMTTEDLKYIVETELNDSMDVITPLLEAQSITITKLEVKHLSVGSVRVKFNTSEEVIECYKCKKYTGQIPSTWTEGVQYDIIDGVTYRYLLEPVSNLPLKDVYDFSEIKVIELKRKNTSGATT